MLTTKQYYASQMPFDGLEAILSQGDLSFSNYHFTLFRESVDGTKTAVTHDTFFPTPQHLRSAMLRLNANRLDIGQYVVHDSEGALPPASPLVFDIDANDYASVFPADHDPGELEDEPRVIKANAWWTVCYSTRLLDLFLKYMCYGSECDPPYRSLAVFSGRRGIHLWVLGRLRDRFNASEIEQRIINPLSKLATSAVANVTLLEVLLKVRGADPAVGSLLEQAAQYARQALSSRIFWGKAKDETIGAIREMLPDALKRCDIPKLWEAFSDPEVPQVLDDLTWMALGLLLLAPRIDVKVTTATRHLIKAPFSVHPQNGVISMPFDLHAPSLTWPRDIVVPCGRLFDVQEFARLVAIFETLVPSQRQ